MASLNDAANVVDELEQLVRRLSDQVAREPTDFLQVVVRADEVAAAADSLAATFAAVDEQLGRGLDAANGKTGRSAQRRTQRGGAKRQQRRASAKRPPQRRGSKRQARAPRTRRSETVEETKSELLEQAQEAVIPGRSSMSKDELAKAVESQDQQTKEELLEQAKAAGIQGRSEMSKQELLEALRKEASASREELLERAREANIEGRAEMSKDELRNALRSESR